MICNLWACADCTDGGSGRCPVSRETNMERSAVQQHIGECYAQGAPCECPPAADGPYVASEETDD